ncbi:RNA recognition motif. (a.k.a. RRM, RBD, or RNP domain), putative [Leishmania lindenbergi]|uniref:RNA recognition motif (RRM, RBD, or RNP domain) n=1 Tax=Leishmania lindenbergi TaxID=651832 RepID=A0AAW2ZXE0_9TRYP
MYVHPIVQPMSQSLGSPTIVNGAYRVNAIPVLQQQFLYTTQPMMATQSMIQTIPATTSMYSVAPPRRQKNKGNAVLFVGQLNYDVTEKDVHHLFSHYGQVVNVVLLKDTKRNSSKDASSPQKSSKHVVGSSAFVTYPTTAEADLAIVSLHNRYCMDNRDKPVQVSYCQKTDIISDFGYRHALQLHSENPANPIPSITPTPSVAYAVKFA